MSIQIDLSGQVAFVTGGGSGIGEAIATTLAEAGAAVAIADLSADSGARVAAQIGAKGGTAVSVQADIADPASVAAALAQVHDGLGAVSVLINNAAAWEVKLFADHTELEQRRIIDITLNGTMTVTRAVLPDIVATRGKIVSVISDGARVGEPYMSVYAAAKAGLIGLTKSVAREVGRSGVTVNGVAPGTTDTPGSAGFIEAAGGAEKLAKAYPLRRLGDPQDIANAVLFLSCPLSSWITGQVLSVSGGFTMI
jgi:NAD(P)-dependent dehydrogenase (short-subunit alcohol dehydrogenase family)